MKESVQSKHEVIQQMIPRYREASAREKGVLLDELATATGYARRYAMWLLNHLPPQRRIQRRGRPARYGPEVRDALRVCWQTANRICSKLLIPFLPTLVSSLERHGHLHLTQEGRSQLLCMSAATADRLLRPMRRGSQHGRSTTRAGTWLKQQIPIRTYQQWNENQPGFLEADLVAHCGCSVEGSYLFTLTLTDIATGWTECLPLRCKSAEAVVSALEQAKACFPFPILGLDTDNGCEFINAYVLAYCETEQITFTRGRPDLKNDQCFVEQKNGAIVRRLTGYDRLEGEHTYRQLGELYQALRLYVNGFQPSMKLQATCTDGRKVRRVYDAAKTPLQRLLLSHVLLLSEEEDLQRVAQVLDPLRLFDHLQDLQRALFSTTRGSASWEGTSPVAVVPFCIQRCIAGPHATDPEHAKGAWQPAVLLSGASVSSGFSDSEKDCHAPSPRSNADSRHGLNQSFIQASSLPAPSTAEEEKATPAVAMSGVCKESHRPGDGPPQAHHQRVGQRPSAWTLEQAVQEYLQDRRSQHRRPKTLEWYMFSLESFQDYLRTEYQCVLLDQIKEAQVQGWLAFLQRQSIPSGRLRARSTIESYARSARAFCQWAVRQHYLQTTPFEHLSLPQAPPRQLPVLQAEEWEQLLQACRPLKESEVRADQAEARNRTILWVLFDTGMRVTELCQLRVADVDRKQGVLSVRGKGSKARQLTLSQEGRRHLLAYLDSYRLEVAASEGRGDRSSEFLFLSEAGRPLGKEGIAQVFGRVRKRAGITRKGVSVSLLRASFAVRYLQAGGDLEILWEVLGQRESASFQDYLRSGDEGMAKERK